VKRVKINEHSWYKNCKILESLKLQETRLENCVISTYKLKILCENIINSLEFYILWSVREWEKKREKPEWCRTYRTGTYRVYSHLQEEPTFLSILYRIKRGHFIFCRILLFYRVYGVSIWVRSTGRTHENSILIVSSRMGKLKSTNVLYLSE